MHASLYSTKSWVNFTNSTYIIVENKSLSLKTFNSTKTDSIRWLVIIMNENSKWILGRGGGGQVEHDVTFNSDDHSSSPAEV